MAAELRRESCICETQLDVNLVSRCAGDLFLSRRPIRPNGVVSPQPTTPLFYRETTVLEFRMESHHRIPRYHRPSLKSYRKTRLKRILVDLHS